MTGPIDATKERKFIYSKDIIYASRLEAAVKTLAVTHWNKEGIIILPTVSVRLILDQN